VIRRGVGLVVLAIALATCASPAPLSPSAPPVSAAPTGPPAATPTPGLSAMDFGGTAWRVEALDGQPLLAGAAPTLRLESGNATTGDGVAFSGCSSFSVVWTLDGGRARIRPQGVDLGTCPGVAGQVEAALLARLTAATVYSVSGDSLTLAGPAGQIQLVRDVPPIGDPGRVVLELLRTGEWRVVSLTGTPTESGLTRISFPDDTTIVGRGGCGFSGGFRLLPQGRVSFEEIGWDTAGPEDPDCDAADSVARVALKGLLETATSARLGADGRSVVFSGPNGDVVLGR
jgi:heat shock protein HslJ